jgi:hypothetical protein
MMPRDTAPDWEQLIKLLPADVQSWIAANREVVPQALSLSEEEDKEE